MKTIGKPMGFDGLKPLRILKNKQTFSLVIDGLKTIGQLKTKNVLHFMSFNKTMKIAAKSVPPNLWFFLMV